MWRPQRVVVLVHRQLTLSSLSCQRKFSEHRDEKPPTPLHNLSEYSLERLLGPSDNRVPLPGNVGLCEVLNPPLPPQNLQQHSDNSISLLTASLNYQRQSHTLQEVSKHIYEDEVTRCFKEVEENKVEVPEPIQTGLTDSLECVAQECPGLVRKDLGDLFPERDLSQGNLTAVTLTQRTDLDMSVWSPEVEEERDHLTDCFVTVALEFCDVLKEKGFWADFIDPSCGRPFLSATKGTLLETDGRYQHLGFEIQDQGCCKVIMHRVWGTNAFIGTLFTDAPVESEALKELLHQYCNRS